MKASKCMVVIAACSLVGCASLQSDLDTVDSGIEVVNTMTTKAVLERISNCAYNKRIRTAAKQRLASIPKDTKAEFDAKIADAVIELSDR